VIAELAKTDRTGDSLDYSGSGDKLPDKNDRYARLSLQKLAVSKEGGLRSAAGRTGFVLIGHSLGAAIAISAAASSPDFVRISSSVVRRFFLRGAEPAASAFNIRTLGLTDRTNREAFLFSGYSLVSPDSRRRFVRAWALDIEDMIKVHALANLGGDCAQVRARSRCRCNDKQQRYKPPRLG